MSGASQSRTPDTQLFRDVFNASPIGIVVESMEGQLLFVNPSFCSMLGFSEEELRRKHCVDFSPPEDAEKDWAFFQQLRAGSIDRYQLEKRYFRRDGSLMWGRLSISLLNGRASPLVLAMVEDITDKKEAEKAVRESEERFRSVADDAPVLIWSAGTDKLCTYFNKPWLNFTGRPIEQEVGNGWAEGVHPNDRQRCVDTYMHSFDRRDKFRMEYRLRRHDGEYRWILDMGVPRFNPDKSFAGYIGIAVDVTERRRAEEGLRESEGKFRSVFRDAGVGMVIVSPEGRFLGANTAFCGYLGYTEEELREKTVQSITFADDWPPFRKKLEELLAGASSFRWFDKRCLHKSGRIVHTQSSASLIRSSDGTPQYFVGEVLDVTSRIEAEAALSEMTRKLIAAQEQERARIGRELHDDINQRLAMLAMELEQLQEHPSEIGVRSQELRQQIIEISGDVQALSHDLHSSKLEYLGVAGGIRSWCKEFAERQKMYIDFKSTVRSVIPIEVGRTLLRVLQEALHNASKHSGAKRAEVRLREQSGEIQLVISDSGKGFELDPALQGKGLGLTSMQERVRLLRGTILIKSKPLGGTTIHVRVPTESEQTLRRAVG
jgi:PAS domain S-box-containing protein